jgi:hypothetical protein
LPPRFGELVAAEGPGGEAEECDASDVRDPVLLVGEGIADPEADVDRGEVHDGRRNRVANQDVTHPVSGGECHRHQLGLVAELGQ